MFRLRNILILLVSLWCAAFFRLIPLTLCQSVIDTIVMLPLYGVLAFGCYSMAVISYRVATFNDCTDASNELKLQIEEAKIDLRKIGYRFADELT